MKSQQKRAPSGSGACQLQKEIKYLIVIACLEGNQEEKQFEHKSLVEWARFNRRDGRKFVNEISQNSGRYSVQTQAFIVYFWYFKYSVLEELTDRETTTNGFRCRISKILFLSVHIEKFRYRMYIIVNFICSQNKEIYRAISPRSIYFIFHLFACGLFKKMVNSRRRSI